MSLAPGEEKSFVFTIGNACDEEEIKEQVASASDYPLVHEQLEELKAAWRKNSRYLQVKTPDEQMNTMLNIWHPYQCRMTFNWSRFISFYERGLDRGWGYRRCV